MRIGGLPAWAGNSSLDGLVTRTSRPAASMVVSSRAIALRGWRTVPLSAPPATPITDERPVLVAPDSFKGTLRAAVVAAAIGRGLERGGLVPPDLMPLADGGEGTLETLLLALGGETQGATVRGPLGAPVKAGFGLLADGDGAIVEMAQASGLSLIPEGERDAEAATTYGTGELILAAIDAGAVVVFVGLGGQRHDGRRRRRARGDRGRRRHARRAARRALRRADHASRTRRRGSGRRRARIPRRCSGSRGASEQLAETWPRDPRGVPMTGAAGGLAGGLWAMLGAELKPGARFILDALDAGPRMRAARAVIVGEGRLDPTTLEGKAAGELATDARQAGVPCHAIVGSAALGAFERRIIDLQTVREAGTVADLERAAEQLALSGVL